MDWKLARGKWRPRLQAFAGELSPDSVVETTRAAFASLSRDSVENVVPDISVLKAALLELTKLKVGQG